MKSDSHVHIVDADCERHIINLEKMFPGDGDLKVVLRAGERRPGVVHTGRRHHQKSCRGGVF